MKIRADFLMPVVVIAFFFTPAVVSAAIVPCTGLDTCNVCTFGQLIQNIINYLIVIAIPLAALLFTYGGFLYVTSGARPANRDRAKKIFWDALVGFVLVIGAWLIVNTILVTLDPGSTFLSLSCTITGQRQTNATVKEALCPLFTGLCPSTQTSAGGSAYICPQGTLVNGQCISGGIDVGTPQLMQTSPNNQLQCPPGSSEAGGNCFDNQTQQNLGPATPTVVGTGAPLTLSNISTGVANSQQLQSAFQSACKASGISDCSLLQATCVIESGCAANSSVATGCTGSAGECGIMQVKPSSACQVDSSIPGCSGQLVGDTAQVQMYLENPTNNINVDAKIIAGGLQSCNGNEACALAVQNGGSGAVAPSSDCSSGARWQCPYDSRSASTGQPCNGTTVTDCTLNAGYAITRAYVPAVQTAQGLIKQSTP